MNKIFKVVWSKTKECYIVVSEVAKNNGGKKKVLASVLATLAIMGAGAQMGTPVQAGSDLTNTSINLWSNQITNTTVGGSSSTNNANTVTVNSIAIGQDLSAGSGAVAVGRKSKATGDRAIALGEEASALGKDSISIGNKSNSPNSGGIAIGLGVTANTTVTDTKYQGYAMAIGRDTEAKGQDAVAIGRQNKTTKDLAVSFGNRAEATATGAIAIGTNGDPYLDTTTGQMVPQKTEATGFYSIAVGSQAKTVGAASLAVGGKAQATAASASAFGREANASAENAIALGYKATASIKDGVALGSQSKATIDKGVKGFNPAENRTKQYTELTGNVQTSTLAAISVGDGKNATRQITGLAAGKEDTDAVNVAQLRSVNLKYAGNSGNSDVLLDDGILNIKGDGLLSTSADATGITVKLTKGDDIANDNGKAKEPTNNGVATTQNVVQAINNSYWKATAGGNTVGAVDIGKVKPGNKVTFSAGDNLKVKQSLNNTTGEQEYTYSLNPVLTGITSIANTATGPKMTFGGNSINITGGSLDMGTNKITNLAPGTADNDAVNVKQLKDTELHITPGTYTPDANKKVKLTYTDGNSTVVTGKEAVIDLSGLATGSTTSTEKVQKAADATGDKNIAEVGPKSGDTFGAANATYEVSVSRNAVKDAAREAVTINNGGTKSGTTYTPNADNPITVTPKEDAANHNTTYEVTFDGNKAAKQIPLTYKANGTGDKTVKLDKGLDFTNGTNTTAEIGNDGVVKFNLNKDVDLSNTGSLTVGDTKVNNAGVTITAPTGGSTTNVTLTQSGLDNGGNKIVNVKDGDVSATSKDAVNGSQLHAVAAKERHIAPTTASHAAYTVDNNGDVTLDYVDGDGAATSEKAIIKGVAKQDLSNITNAGKQVITGLSNKVVAGDNITVDETEDATTKQKTYKVNAKLAKLEDGTNTTVTGDGTTGNAYHVNVAGDLTGISSITNGGTNNGKISFGPNKTVTVDGDHSITLNASTGKIGGLQNLTFDPTNFTSGQAATEDQLKSVHDTLKANELHIAPTESNRTGEHIAGGATSNTAAGAAANAYKYDATTKQVVLEYNDGTGANKTGTKAVIDLSNLPTGGDMSSFKVTSSAESTTVGTHAGDTSQEIKNGKSVDFQAGKNMTVKQTNDGNGNTTINYALDKNLDVESVHVGKDGKDGKIGIDGKDGVDGLDGTNRVDIHVEKGAKGVDGTDGHDGVNGHNGKDGMTRIVYEDKGGKQEVATLNDGMKYAGDDAQGTDKTKVIAKKLNETLDIIGGANKTDLTTDNIGVNNDGNGKLLVQLSKNLKGINTIKNGNTTITLNDTPSTTTPAVTITGGNLSLGDGTTNNKIVNVAPGTDDTDAVNVKQLKDAKTVLADGKNTKKSGTGTAADPYKVNVEGDLTEITSITNKADASGNNAGKITFSPNQTVTVSGDHNISLNGKTGDITGLTNTTIPTTAGSDFATKGRAATEEQLKIVNDKFNNKINLGADGSTETTKLALDNNGGIKFNIKGDGSGASGANQYISTTASGSDI